MLEIAESNSKTSNNSIRLTAAILAISIAKLVATAFAILVVATLFKLIIVTPFKRGACKAIRGRAASGTS
jgi:hypothetical protein